MTFNFEINDEGDTLGNLLQNEFVNNNEIQFASYEKVNNKLVFTIKFKTVKTNLDYKTIVNDSVTNLINQIRTHYNYT